MASRKRLEVNRKTVTLGRTRLTREGLDRLWEVAPGRGRKPTYGPEKIQSIVNATLGTQPKGKTQWSCRLMAARQGVSKSIINNTSPTGDRADEKSQIQALDRTQPGLPMKKGRCGTMTHDYKRNGTTSLFAALEVLQGRVIGQCYERHRHHLAIQTQGPNSMELPLVGPAVRGQQVDGEQHLAEP